MASLASPGVSFCLPFLLPPPPLHSSSLSPPGNSILHSAADSVTSAVQKASQALNERGERLGRAEDRTAEMMNSAEQFAVTAHKVSGQAAAYRGRGRASEWVFFSSVLQLKDQTRSNRCL